jgi:hypothetical protein
LPLCQAGSELRPSPGRRCLAGLCTAHAMGPVAKLGVAGEG